MEGRCGNDSDGCVTIFVNGKSSSGKSHLCSALARAGFQVVSASKVFEEHCRALGLSVATRMDLNRRGAELAGSDTDAHQFADALLKRAKSRLVAYDGIRISKTLAELKKLSPGSFCIYLDTSAQTRRIRHTRRHPDIDFDEQDRNETAMGDAEIKMGADIVVASEDGAAGLVGLLAALTSTNQDKS